MQKYKDKRKYSDRAEYLKKSVSKRRKEIRLKSLKYKGDKCSICGYNKCLDALEFHHIDGSNKDFGLSQRGNTRSWEKVKQELDKCILLCSNCHRELHFKIKNKNNKK